GAELLSVLNDITKGQFDLKQYATAEASCQEMLRLLNAQTTLDRETREKVKAGILHNLGWVAEEQRQLGQAEEDKQQALASQVEVNGRYSEATNLHHFGMVAEEQRQWGQAEQYYQQALAIKIEFNDRYSQARTLHHLGWVAQEQRQWGQA